MEVRKASSSHEIVVWSGHVIPVADMSSICITTLRRRSQLIDRRLLCTRGPARTAAADGKANDCNNCSLSFPFRTKALRGGACTSPRSTCERARRKLGNPVNSCTAIRSMFYEKCCLSNKYRVQFSKSDGRAKSGQRSNQSATSATFLRRITRRKMFLDERNDIYFKSGRN